MRAIKIMQWYRMDQSSASKQFLKHRHILHGPVITNLTPASIRYLFVISVSTVASLPVLRVHVEPTAHRTNLVCRHQRNVQAVIEVNEVLRRQRVIMADKHHAA